MVHVVGILAVLIASSCSYAADVTLFTRNYSDVFDAYPVTAVIVEGTRVTLVCNVTSGSSISWFARPVFDFSQIPSGESIGRAAWAKSAMEIGQTLVIPSFSKDFERGYECDTSGTGGGFVPLILAVAPEIIVFDTPNVNLSSSVTFTCSAPEANPVPDYIQISLGGTIFGRETGKYNVTYRLTDAKLIDATTYTCSAENKAGKREGSSTLVVQTVPTISSLNGTVTRAKLGSNATLSCEPKGIPYPAVHWLKAGTVLQQNSPHLALSTITEESGGIYTCVGKNDAGQGETTIQLQIQVPPVAPNISEDITVKTNVSITVTIIPGFDGLSKIIAYGVQYKQSNESDWTTALNLTMLHGDPLFTVSDLLPYTSYDFRARAMNDVGAGPFGEAFSHRTHPNAPSARPSDLVNGTVGFVDAELSWKVANSSFLAVNEAPILYYEVGYTAEGQEAQYQRASNNLTSVKLTGLMKGTEYTIAAYAKNSGPYRSPPSNFISITTETTLPGSPVISEVIAGGTSFTVKWAEPGDTGGLPIISYRFEYRDLSAGEWIVIDEEYEGTQKTVSGLRPVSQYSVRITARSTRGAGPSTSRDITTQSAIPIPPVLTPASIIRNGESEIELLLETNRPYITGYKVYYLRAGKRTHLDGDLTPQPSIGELPAGSWKTQTFEGGSGVMLIKDLEYGSVYYIQVTSGVYENFGKPSNVLQTYTEYFLGLELVAEPSNLFSIGGTITLTCQSREGDRIRDATWKFDGQSIDDRLEEADGQLVIEQATETTEGRYSCVHGETGYEGEIQLLLSGNFVSKRDSTAPIAGGITVAVIVFLCILVSLIWYCQSRTKKRREKEAESEPNMMSYKRKGSDVVDGFKVADPEAPPYTKEPPPGTFTLSMTASNPTYGIVRPERIQLSESPPSSPTKETAV